MKRRNINDFWVFWGKLTVLEIRQRKKKWIVNCRKCNRNSSIHLYNEKIFGVDIRVTGDRKRDLKKKNKEHEERLKKLSYREEIERNLQWQIWWSYADLDINLQWLTWLKTFWFDWLIKWIFHNSTCPNWREEITQFNIRPNKEWRKVIDILDIQSKRQEKYIWNKHHRDCDLYWTICRLYIWNSWIASQVHINHRIIENCDVMKELKLLESNDLSDITITERHGDSIEINEFLKQVNLKILFESLMYILSWIAKRINYLNNDFEDKP